MIEILIRAALGAVAGAIAGSFVATLVLRWARGQSVGGRSSCDQCGRQLGVTDLVPLLSAIATLQRCRRCGAPIDPTHWQIELLCAVIGSAAMVSASGYAAPALALMGLLLVPLGWLDFRHYWLPDRLVILLGLSGLAFGGFLGTALEDRLIGLAAGWVVLAGVAWIYRRARGQIGLGAGDPKLFGAIGAWLGWVNLPAVLLGASVIGLFSALILRRGLGDRLAFGTPLCAAAWFVAFAQAVT